MQLIKVEKLQQTYPRPYSHNQHQLHLVQNTTHTAFYSIVHHGTVLPKYALFMLVTSKHNPKLATVALVPQVPQDTMLPLQEIPRLTQEVHLEDIVSITTNQKRLKFYFKNKDRSKWRIKPANQSVLNDWSELLKRAIHHDNLLKTDKHTILKAGWEQFKARLTQANGEDANRESQRFRQQKEEALMEVGYSLQLMARCFVDMKRSKAEVKQQLSTWKSEYKTTIDEHYQIRLISEILSWNEAQDTNLVV